MQVYPDPNNPNTQFLGAEEISKKKTKKTMKELDSYPKLRAKGEIVQHLGYLYPRLCTAEEDTLYG